MSLWASIKTYALVSIVSVLIWVWAEAESLSTVPVSPRVELVTSGTDVTARVLDASWNGTVRMRLRGSSASVSQAQSRLATAVTFKPGIGGIPATPGEHVVGMVDALRNHPELARLGVNFIDVEPAIIRIKIDALASRTIPLQPVLPGVDLAGEAKVSPEQVTIRVREGELESLPAVLTASATPDQDTLSALVGDGPHTVAARITIPSLPSWIGPVTVEPARAQVTFTRRGQAVTVTVAEAAVWVVLPPDQAGAWIVTPEARSVANVRITGRRELLDQLRASPDGVRAYVVLRAADLAEGVKDAPITFTVTPSMLKFECDVQTVRVKIERRK
jgi:hypothetical protein